jgi:hypothetical protein
MPKSRSVKQLQMQKAKLARKLLTNQKSNTHVRFYTQRLFALNYLICQAAASGSKPSS